MLKEEDASRRIDPNGGRGGRRDPSPGPVCFGRFERLGQGRRGFVGFPRVSDRVDRSRGETTGLIPERDVERHAFGPRIVRNSSGLDGDRKPVPVADPALVRSYFFPKPGKGGVGTHGHDTGRFEKSRRSFFVAGIEIDHFDASTEKGIDFGK